VKQVLRRRYRMIVALLAGPVGLALTTAVARADVNFPG
jgi:hypothetical protein